MQIDGDTPRFLLKHASMKWVNVNDTVAMAAAKIIMLTETTTGIQLAIGRINITSAQAGAFTTVGMVVNGSSGRKLWYMTGIGFSDSSIATVTANYEMLSC